MPQTTNAIYSYDDLDSSEHSTFDADRVTFTAIAKTLPIDTLMCVSFDNNENYTRCENESVNRNNYAMLVLGHSLRKQDKAKKMGADNFYAASTSSSNSQDSFNELE